MHLTTLSAKAVQNSYESPPLSPHQYSHICLDLRPNGQALGVPGTLARRLSVQRAATIGPRANVYQIVIRDTTALDGEPEQAAGPNNRFGRSRSLLSTNGRIPVLCPKRSDRARIEHAMAKVWTKEILPYPVMKTHQKENMIRASASSVMRKLSRSTIANSLSKRTMSHRKTSATKSGDDSRDDGFEESQLRPKTPCNQANLPVRPESRGQFSIMTQMNPRRSKRSPSRAHTETDVGMDELDQSFEEIEVQEPRGARAERSIKSRWSSPAALLGSFSSDGFRGFFV